MYVSYVDDVCVLHVEAVSYSRVDAEYYVYPTWMVQYVYSMWRVDVVYTYVGTCVLCGG